jgi:hypothetical protein
VANSRRRLMRERSATASQSINGGARRRCQNPGGTREPPATLARTAKVSALSTVGAASAHVHEVRRFHNSVARPDRKAAKYDAT